MNQLIHSLDIEFSDNNILSSLFGANDINIQTLEKINNVKIQYRGNKVKILGSKKSVRNTKNELIKIDRVKATNSDIAIKKALIGKKRDPKKKYFSVHD